tara:strand:- start:128 stop:376 length:249 start_codon:yes stop_codon:yes gene_type:complete
MKKNNIEELSKFSDEKISFLVGDYRGKIFQNERSERKNDRSKLEFLKALQVEYCYLKREQEIRESRQAAHKRYTEELFQKNG